jgi:hypothetical protein
MPIVPVVMACFSARFFREASAAYRAKSTQAEDQALEKALRLLELSTSRGEQALDQALAEVRDALNAGS